jgi:hypothetical protein
MGHRLQQMRLAEANRRMGIERVEKRRDVDRALFGDAACRRVSKLVRRADEKRREGQSTIQRRTVEAVGLSLRVGLTGGVRKSIVTRSTVPNTAATRALMRS